MLLLTCCTAPGWMRAWPVTYVQNVTDVDDPLLERATATNVDWRELAEDQTELFRTDMKALKRDPAGALCGCGGVH